MECRAEIPCAPSFPVPLKWKTPDYKGRAWVWSLSERFHQLTENDGENHSSSSSSSSSSSASSSFFESTSLIFTSFFVFFCCWFCSLIGSFHLCDRNEGSFAPDTGNLPTLLSRIVNNVTAGVQVCSSIIQIIVAISVFHQSNTSSFFFIQETKKKKV